VFGIATHDQIEHVLLSPTKQESAPGKGDCLKNRDCPIGVEKNREPGRPNFGWGREGGEKLTHVRAPSRYSKSISKERENV